MIFWSLCDGNKFRGVFVSISNMNMNMSLILDVKYFINEKVHKTNALKIWIKMWSPIHLK